MSPRRTELPPKLGDRIIYESVNDDGIKSPGVILRTVDTTDQRLAQSWMNSLSGAERPADFSPALDSEWHVDILVHGLGGDYRRFNIPFGYGPDNWHR